MGRLEGKVAIITGGTSGIGESSARLFVREGCRVVIAGRSDAAGARLTEELGSAALFVRTDVSVEDDVRALVERAVTAFGRLDCMFNNAGISGETTADALARFDSDVALFQPHLVLITFGGNDSSAIAIAT